MEHITEREAVNLLEKYAPDERTFGLVLAHGRRVAEIALHAGDDIKGLDRQFILTASILHDIGRFEHPPGAAGSLKHGIAGAEILRKEGLPMHARVAECHIGIGISKDDIKAQKLDLPCEDYLPESKEEIIIAYADNLDVGGEVRSEEFVEERYAKEVDEGFRVRVKEFHKKVHDMMD